MTDAVKTTFPVMGSAGVPSQVVNVSGERSPYTQLVPKKGAVGESGFGSPGSPRTHAEVNAEVLGPVCAPQTTLVWPNAADHEKTGRNTKILPSRSGVSDFWAQRG